MESQIFKFNYITKKGDKKSKKIDVDNFVGIKNWKAIGNKLIGYNRLSAFKVTESENDSNGNSNEEDDSNESVELTLF